MNLDQNQIGCLPYLRPVNFVTCGNVGKTEPHPMRNMPSENECIVAVWHG